MEGTVYYIRLYSTNERGMSEMSEISNFTTTGIAWLQFLIQVVW